MKKGRFSRFCIGSQKFVCRIESKFLNSRVLAGGFLIGCAKKVLVLSIYSKVVEKVCNITKSLRSQTKV